MISTIAKLDDSIEHVQAVLEDAQHVLRVADEAKRKAFAVAVTVRRAALIGAAVGAVAIVVVVVLRRRSQAQGADRPE